MGTTGFIYGLRAEDGQIRYVGLTSSSVSKRLARHRSNARSGHELRVYRWMRKHGPESVEAVTLEECDIADLNEREIFWIAEMRSRGADLVNCTDGGDGVRNLSPESRAKISAAKSGANHPLFGKPAYIRGRKMPSPSIETRAKKAEAMKEFWRKKYENYAPGDSYEGKTHCPSGHQYTMETTGIYKSPTGTLLRYCKSCRKAYKARMREAARERKVAFG